MRLFRRSATRAIEVPAAEETSGVAEGDHSATPCHEPLPDRAYAIGGDR